MLVGQAYLSTSRIVEILEALLSSWIPWIVLIDLLEEITSFLIFALLTILLGQRNGAFFEALRNELAAIASCSSIRKGIKGLPIFLNRRFKLLITVGLTTLVKKFVGLSHVLLTANRFLPEQVLLTVSGLD